MSKQYKRVREVAMTWMYLGKFACQIVCFVAVGFAIMGIIALIIAAVGGLY